MISRREFLSLTSSHFLFVIGGQVFFGDQVSAQARRDFPGSAAANFVSSLPQFDGVFLVDQENLKKYSRDFGLNISYKPQGILRPAHVKDLQKVVGYCQSRGLPVTVRGTGGAAYGQAQVQDGILIDTTSLKKIQWVSADSVSMEPGLIWKEVLDFTIQKKLTPPVLPDTIVTSVGGKASVGGIGETSYNQGSMADHITELDVLTMGGELKTCNRNTHADLFYAALGGMGQCGIITRVVMRLMRAPESVKTISYTYDLRDFRYLRDLELISSQEARGAIGGHFVLPNPSQPYQYQMDVTYWGQDSAPWMTQVGGKPSPTKTWSYFDYANRNTKGWIEAVNGGALNLPRPYLSFYMPYEQAQKTVEYLFAQNDSVFGASRIYMAPLWRKPFKRPFFSLPQSEKIMHFRLYKIVRTGGGGQDHKRMLTSNVMDLVPRVLSGGGTVYLPFSPLLRKDQIEKQFTPQMLRTLVQLKGHYDRRILLNRSVGLFS